MLKFNYMLIVSILVTGMTLLNSCEKENTPEENEPVDTSVSVESITLDKTEISLTEGLTETLKATVLPENATNKNFSWTTSSKEIATIDDNGKISAIKIGEAIITATTEDGAKTATCKVTVSINPNNYVDEYGVNHGEGIKLICGTGGEVIWAPVNCGYHETDYKYGKLYQFSRKYGQGYDDSDKTFPSAEQILDGPISLEEGNDEKNQNNFYKNNDPDTGYDG